ncbi:MAG TPA: AmmeMemoRadiSam system protein A [Clostridia bacterium]|nr:AmmeMemoRadiSam system protein A [Clostridia bacterium]
MKNGEEGFLVRVARKSLESYVKGKWDTTLMEEVPVEFRHRAGAFVTLKKDGELRGCIGTIAPRRDNVAEEVLYNAVAAGTEDSRFFPMAEDELKDLVYSVDVLGEPEPVKDVSGLDPKNYGVIVRKGFRSGLLLPNIEGVDTVEMQLGIACQKAGINPYDDYKIERFKVTRYK